MADAGFFKGTSAEQDSRFANKQKKLLKQMKFPENIDVKIDMSKVNLDTLKPWITNRLQELLGIEDDVVIEFVFNQLDEKRPDPKLMQINLTGFLGGSKARLFIGELWKFLTSAQSSPDGIPVEFVEMKKKETLKRQEEENRLREIRKREEESLKQDIKIENKSRSHHERRRSPIEIRRTSEIKERENENDRQNFKVSSPSPIKSSRTNEKEKISSNSVKRNRSSSSNFSSTSSKSVKLKSKKQTKKSEKSRNKSSSRSRSRTPERSRKSKKHRSQKSKSSSRKENKRKSHHDRPDKSKTKKSHRNESSNKLKDKKHSNPSELSTDNEISKSSKSTIKPRLESQIKMQTPPPLPKLSEENKSQQIQSVELNKPSTRTERIVVLEESRTDSSSSISTRVSITTKQKEQNFNHSSEDENEIDLRERLLREKAIQSMKRRQLSSTNKFNTKPTTDRIVYET